MKRKIALCMVCVSILMLLAGCGNRQEQGSGETSTEKEDFYILACSGTEVETMKKVIEEAGDELPYNVIVEDSPWAQFSEKMSMEMASGANHYGLMLMPAQWMEDYADFLSEVELDTADFVESLVETYKVDGKQLGIPYYAMVLLNYYRTDIWEEAGITGAPSTWQEWYSAIEKVAAVTGDDMAATTIPLANTTHLSSFYATLLWDKGTDVIVDGEVKLNTPEAKEALEFLCSLYENNYLPTSVFELGFSEGSELFAQGQAASTFDYNRKIAILNDPESSVVTDDWSAYAVPGNATLMGPWGFVIPSAAEDEKASLYMLEWLTSADNMTELAMEGLAVSRISVLDNTEVLSKVPEMEVVLDSLNKAQRELWPNYDAVSQVLIQGLSDAVAGNSTVDDALAEMQQEIEELLAS